MRPPPSPLWLLIVLPLAVACGGRIWEAGADGGPPPSEGGAPAVTPDPAASGTPFPLCPFDPPTTGTSCSTPYRGCAYPTSTGCASWECDKTGVWRSSTPLGC